MSPKQLIEGVPRWLKITAVVVGLLGGLTALGINVIPWDIQSRAKAAQVYQTKEEAKTQHELILQQQQDTLQKILKAITDLKGAPNENP